MYEDILYELTVKLIKVCTTECYVVLEYSMHVTHEGVHILPTFKQQQKDYYNFFDTNNSHVLKYCTDEDGEVDASKN